MSNTDFDPRINLHALDQEWLRQAEMYYRAAVQQADARKAVEEAKQNLDVVRAEVELEIRKDPASYGLEKVTEGGVAAALASQPEIKAAMGRHNDARHHADICGAATSALDHKKKALELLTDLQGRNYFAEPWPRTEEAKDVISEANKRGVRSRGVRQREVSDAE